MGEFPDVFNPALIERVRQGEHSGTLEMLSNALPDARTPRMMQGAGSDPGRFLVCAGDGGVLGGRYGKTPRRAVSARRGRKPKVSLESRSSCPSGALLPPSPCGRAGGRLRAAGAFGLFPFGRRRVKPGVVASGKRCTSEREARRGTWGSLRASLLLSCPPTNDERRRAKVEIRWSW
jgi:hypothetical protein